MFTYFRIVSVKVIRGESNNLSSARYRCVNCPGALHHCIVGQTVINVCIAVGGRRRAHGIIEVVGGARVCIKFL